MDIDLASDWSDLLDEIANDGKYVALDLSDCTMSGTAFDPDSSSSTGKDLIVSLTLPDDAESIAAGTDYQDSAFKHFTNLTTVSGENITAVGDYAFTLNDALTSASLPQAQTIGNYAFSGCTALTSVDLSQATTIGDCAFQNCTALNNVILSASLGTIGINPFAGCTSLTNLTVAAGNNNYSAVNGMLMNNAGTTLIGYPAAAGAVTLSSITNVGAFAFYGCTALASVDLSSATSIGYAAFAYCTALTSVSLPQATTIGVSAFGGCTALTSVNLSAATSIGTEAFRDTGTTTLTVTLGATAPSTVGDEVFVHSAKTVTVEVPSGATGYGATLPLTVSGADTTVCWANGFRGAGWNGSAFTDYNSSINQNITVTITAQP